jgi:uncharacterized oligopeptide transporter (OPT) family protein
MAPVRPYRCAKCNATLSSYQKAIFVLSCVWVVQLVASIFFYDLFLIRAITGVLAISVLLSYWIFAPIVVENKGEKTT